MLAVSDLVSPLPLVIMERPTPSAMFVGQPRSARKVPHTKESAVTSIYDPEATYVGLDVHKDTISVGVLEPG